MANNTMCIDCGGFAPLRVKRCVYCANDRLDLEREKTAQLEKQRDEAQAALEAHTNRCAVIIGDCQQEVMEAQAAAARWRDRARFWRRLASWMFPDFYEHVTQGGEYRQFTFRRYATNARRSMSKAKLS